MAKPIFCATHPRACSTAFERVFMTRQDLTCFHEPFGEAFYYGPERMSVRFESDEELRETSGYSDTTYQSTFDAIDRETGKGKRIFIKDILYYLVPPMGQLPKLATSLYPPKRGIGTETITNGANGVNGGTDHHPTNGTNGTNGMNGNHHHDSTNGTNGINGYHRVVSDPPFPYPTKAESGNPTIVPKALLDKFHFTFLIRNPHSSIPSWYRCTVPPLEEVTGFHDFYTHEAGYGELRRFFDYARAIGLVRDKPTEAVNEVKDGQATNSDTDVPEVCLVDADDLLDDPEGILRAYCRSVGIDFHPEMLNWDDEELQHNAKVVFEKWKGFHDDAIDSTDLKPRKHVSTPESPTVSIGSGADFEKKKAAKTEEQWDAEWKEKYGEQAAKMIRRTVDENMADFLYLKQFALKAEH